MAETRRCTLRDCAEHECIWCGTVRPHTDEPYLPCDCLTDDTDEQADDTDAADFMVIGLSVIRL